MIAKDEGALICDLAETYNVYDYRVLPPQMAATLAVGLRDTSRIKMKSSGQKADYRDLLLAAIFDQIRMLMWDGKSDRPESVVSAMLDEKPKDNKSTKSFSSPEAFEEARNKILGGG